MSSLALELAAETDGLRERSLYRRMRRQDLAPGSRAFVDGRELLLFGSNNYLGLANSPQLRAAAIAAVERWGGGATGSRLTTGNLALFERLEAELAELKGQDAALLFPSGYQAAVATLPALVRSGDLILSDALNHACLIDGCRLSGAEVRVYRHRDFEHAAALLQDRQRFRRCLLVTDGVFSMDGDVADLPALCDLAEAHEAWVMVDDAHGTGVLGDSGGGTAEQQGARQRVDIHFGTLSKALGSVGGFIAGSAELIDYLHNRARGFIFTTAPNPAAAGAALAALEAVRRQPDLREKLSGNGRRLRASLRARGVEVPDGITPIIPVLVGEAERALAVMARLEAKGIWIPAIRPPTVPAGTARLRMSVTAEHSHHDLDLAADAVATALAETA